MQLTFNVMYFFFIMDDMAHIAYRNTFRYDSFMPRVHFVSLILLLQKRSFCFKIFNGSVHTGLRLSKSGAVGEYEEHIKAGLLMDQKEKQRKGSNTPRSLQLFKPIHSYINASHTVW